MSGKVLMRPNVCCHGGCIYPVDAAVPHWTLVPGLYCDFHKKFYSKLFGTISRWNSVPNFPQNFQVHQ